MGQVPWPDPFVRSGRRATRKGKPNGQAHLDIAEIVDQFDAAVKFYQDVLGLEVRREGEGYAIVELSGVLHFGIWSRASAAETTFGDPGAADRIPVGSP